MVSPDALMAPLARGVVGCLGKADSSSVEAPGSGCANRGRPMVFHEVSVPG
jgi:hypothetical protein